MAKIFDSEILEWINNEDLVIYEDFTVDLFGRNNNAYMGGAKQKGEPSERFYYRFRNKGRRRTIARSKLVYMYHHKMIIPEGFEIHHLNGNIVDDRILNLIMLMHHDHLKIHNSFCEEEIPF